MFAININALALTVKHQPSIFIGVGDGAFLFQEGMLNALGFIATARNVFCFIKCSIGVSDSEFCGIEMVGLSGMNPVAANGFKHISNRGEHFIIHFNERNGFAGNFF